MVDWIRRCNMLCAIFFFIVLFLAVALSAIKYDCLNRGLRINMFQHFFGQPRNADENINTVKVETLFSL